MGKDEDLIDEQISKSAYEVLNMLPAELTSITSKNTLLAAQSDKTAKEELLVEANTSVANAKVTTEDDIRTKIIADTALISAKESEVLYNVTDILPMTRSLLTEQARLLDFQCKESASNTQDIYTAGQEAHTTNTFEGKAGKAMLRSDADTALIAAQRKKVEEEKRLIDYKIRAEALQTEDYYTFAQDAASISTDDVGGMLKRQQDLIEAQTKGFADKSMIDGVKAIMDGWIVTKSIDEGTSPPDSVNPSEVSVALDKMRASVGID